MSDNPYESPAEISLDDFSSENATDAGPQRLYGFIWTVLILDCILCLFILILFFGLIFVPIDIVRGCKKITW